MSDFNDDDIPRPPPQLAFMGALVMLLSGLVIGFVSGVVITLITSNLFN